MRRCRGMVLVTSWLVACGGSTDGDGHPQTSDTQPTDSPPVVRLGWTDLQVVDVTDIRQIEARLEEAGVPTRDSTTAKSESGPASFVVVDPDGNAILFDQHV